jgi:hypothetical protein
MARRRKRGHHPALAVVLATVLAAVVLVLWHAVIGAAFIVGAITGAGCVLAVARPRLSLLFRASTRGTRTRTRPLGGGRP